MDVQISLSQKKKPPQLLNTDFLGIILISVMRLLFSIQY